MTEQFKILILGYGEMGHAMEFLLRDQHQVNIWDKYPQNNFKPVSLEDKARDSDIVLFCLPVNPHHEVALRIAPLLKPHCLCLSIAKGLDESGKTAAQIFDNIFAERQPYGFLYGPMISEEIRAGHYAFAQVACSRAESYDTVKKIFSGTSLLTESTADISGISWSVILKNVYALVFGMADELQLGDNTRGFLMVTALDELNKIVLNMSGQAGSPYHLAGLGDLVTTATSDDSHHHELGRMLAREELKGIEGEGIHTLKMVVQHNLLDKADYPLFEFIHNIVLKPKNVQKQFDTYLKYQYN